MGCDQKKTLTLQKILNIHIGYNLLIIILRAFILHTQLGEFVVTRYVYCYKDIFPFNHNHHWKFAIICFTHLLLFVAIILFI